MKNIHEKLPRHLSVGDTKLKHAEKLGKLIGVENLYLKLEGENPTHTYKDRAAVLIALDAVQNGYEGVTIGTCGNFGVSIATFALANNLECITFIPERYRNDKKVEIEDIGAKVIYTKGAYEDAVQQSSDYSQKNGLYDANPCATRAANISIRGYSHIAREIISTIKRQVSSVWTAVGNGTGLTGMAKGFADSNMFPIFGAASSRGNNAVLESYFQKKVVTLSPESLTESAVNEALLNYQSYQAEESLKALGSNGLVYGATDRELVDSANLIWDTEGVHTTPASACVLAGLIAKKHIIDPAGAHVLVLTS